MKKKILIVVGITILFLGTCIIQSVAIDNVKKSSSPISSGNTLYVGGSGEGNYTSIQDAIDNASEGDTVFVYDDISPYYEYIVVHKSINLIGEDKNTTIIDGSESGIGITVNTGWVTISSFTIQNCSSGILIGSDYNIISDNFIKNNEFGIDILYTGKNTIKNNFFANNAWGISVWDSDDIIIEHNYIFSNVEGVELKDSRNSNITNNLIFENDENGVKIWTHSRDSKNNLVKCNNISNNRCGISVTDSYYVTIENNNIYHNNQTGLSLAWSRGCTISKNNLIENSRNAYFRNIFSTYRKNKWDNNYWSDYKGIFGFPKIIRGKLYFLPSFALDWHPAKEPYDMKV